MRHAPTEALPLSKASRSPPPATLLDPLLSRPALLTPVPASSALAPLDRSAMAREDAEVAGASQGPAEEHADERPVSKKQKASCRVVRRGMLRPG